MRFNINKIIENDAWAEMSWNEPKWAQKSLNEPKSMYMSSIGPKWGTVPST